MGRVFVSCFLAGALVAGADDYSAAQRKMDLIEQDRARPGSRVAFTKDELNAWVRQAVTRVAPEGVRESRLELGNGAATGFAYVDFPRLRRAQGEPMGWLMEKLLAGERPVKVEARIRSGGGQATVDVERVEISGMELSGATLDFVIRNFLWPYYPEAKIGKPFELAHRIERLEVRPTEVRVVIGK
jgi:hypothetical protein